MATKPAAWPDTIEGWPANQSNAARDRDDAAMNAAQVSKLARQARERVRNGEQTREEMLYVFGKIDSFAADILRLLERNGAPTRPYQNGR